MKKVYKFIERLYDKKIDASGLAVFRVLYSIILLSEVLQIFYFKNLIYDRIPFLKPFEINLEYALWVWIISIIFLGLGYFTRQATIINYILSLVFIATLKTYEYHMFYAYMGINALLIFVNTSQTGSIDSLLAKLDKVNVLKGGYSSKVSVLNYYTVIVVAIGFVYIDSVFFKLNSYNWRSGLGMWLPASLPHVTHLDAQFFLNQKWLMLVMGYVTVVFEAIFIFVFFIKRFRVPLLIIGVLLHAGILLVFPIPWFALGVIALYMLMVPVGYWKVLKRKISFKNKVTIFFDKECLFCTRIQIFLEHFDFFGAIEFKGFDTNEKPEKLYALQEELQHNIYAVRGDKIYKGVSALKYLCLRTVILSYIWVILSLPFINNILENMLLYYKGLRGYRNTSESDESTSNPVFAHKLKQFRILTISSGYVILIFLQITISYNSGIIPVIREKTGFSTTALDKYIEAKFKNINRFSRHLLGITYHPVFMDSHFDKYNHIIAIESEYDGNKEWLPIIDKEGHPDLYIYSFNWVKWTFRVNSPNINEETLVLGIRDFSTFWAVKNGIPLDKVKFNIYVKKIDIPTEWEYDFLKKQKAKPWQKIGQAYWEGKIFKSEIPDIESL